jgi:23S rRNA (guanine745-N1)-methyltransferase
MLELTCPQCHAPLSQQGAQWRCENNHSYDQARQGYLNLLLVHPMSSSDPGARPLNRRLIASLTGW